MSLIKIRELLESDYNNGYLELLSQLSVVEKEKINENDFKNFIGSLSKNHKVFVMEDNKKIIGNITIIIEKKIIHNISNVCHIEDVVVDTNYRGKNLGKQLIEYAKEYAKLKKCYKIILNCDEKHKKFYEKLNFNLKNYEMSLYL